MISFLGKFTSEIMLKTIDLFACNTGTPPFLFNLTENTPVVIANSVIPYIYDKIFT